MTSAIDTLRAADLSALCEAAAFMHESTIGPEALLWGRAEVRLDEAATYIRQAIAAHDEAARLAGASRVLSLVMAATMPPMRARSGPVRFEPQRNGRS